MAEVYSIEIEKQSIAGLIQHPAVWADLQGLVTDAVYFNDIHRAIFQVTCSLIDEGKEVNAVMVAERVRNLNITFKEDLNVYDYIENLALITTSEASTIDSFKELMKVKLRRDLWLDFKRGQKEMETCGNLPFDQIVGRADAIINNRINQYDLVNEPRDLFGEMEAIIEERGNNPVEETGLIPPYKLFRKLYGGFTPGDLYAFVSRAKAGKSTLLSDIMRKTCNESNPDIKVYGLMLDTELETERVMYRMVSSLTGINEWYLKTGKWRQNKGMTEKVRAAWKIIKPFFGSVDHVYVAGKPIEEVISIIRRWYYKKIRSKAAYAESKALGKEIEALICYDYLKMTGEKVNDANKEHQVMGQKVDRLKQTGSELKSPIITACQMNRAGENRRDASKLSDDGNAIAMSDRLSWFASLVAIFRRKTVDEIASDGEEFGTHKMIPIFTRNQGEESQGFFDMVKVMNDEGDEQWHENFLNFDVKNFNVTEKGSLKDIAARRRLKFNIAHGNTGGLL